MGTLVWALGCGSPAAVESHPVAEGNEHAASTASVASEPSNAARSSAEGCSTPWHLDPARGPDALTCRQPDGTEVTTDCEACAMRDGTCFADLPGETVERSALDGTHHRFAASHTCVPACCARAAHGLAPRDLRRCRELSVAYEARAERSARRRSATQLG